MDKAPRKIGEVARELRISERRIREYERAGLVRPAREAKTGDRLFGPNDVSQLRIIQNLIHQHGFTLEALRQVLRYAPCWELVQCEARESCAAFQSPGITCYDHRATGVPIPCDAECKRCPIYLNRDRPRPPIVMRPCGA